MDIWLITFLVFLIPIPVLAFWGNSRSDMEQSFGGRNFKKWAIGLSAGATGNTGFIMTGAVGLGYAYGLQWVLLPLSWLAGDLLFWMAGPQKIRAYTENKKGESLIGLIAERGSGKHGTILWYTVLLTAICLLGIYIVSQWIAGTKILTPVLNIDDKLLLLGFGAFVLFYSVVGSFRGSVYTDIYQAVLMIFVTTVSLIFVLLTPTLSTTFSSTEGFHSLVGTMTIPISIAFILGWAAAAVGFGFGQPQIVSRYMSGLNEKEVAAARWIYILFLQFTWIGMTLFGYILKTKGFEAVDPESGLIDFFETNNSQVLMGIILAGIFAAIASTVDSILIAISTMIENTFAEDGKKNRQVEIAAILLIGCISLISALYTSASVFDLAVTAISLTGGVLAGPVIIRVFDMPHNQLSLLIGLVGAIIACLVWRKLGLNGYLNEALIGICTALILNWLLSSGNKNKN